MSEEKAWSEIATRNARAAIDKAESTRIEVTKKIDDLEKLINTMNVKLNQLEQRYTTMLIKNFDGGSTVDD